MQEMTDEKARNIVKQMEGDMHLDKFSSMIKRAKSLYNGLKAEHNNADTYVKKFIDDTIQMQTKRHMDTNKLQNKISILYMYI